MALLRRRHQPNYYLRWLIPAISAISATLLLLLVLLSVRTPSPTDNHHQQELHYHRHHLTSLNKNAEVVRPDANGGLKAFRVPVEGESSNHHDLWVSKLSKFYHGCSNASNKFLKAEVNTEPNRYLMIATSGGLNQQRTGITDAVVAARILNATLVVPMLDQKSFWKDTSNFTEIFDVDWFIKLLSEDVKIIKQLPKYGGKAMIPYPMRVPRKCTTKCYQNHVLPVLLKRHVVQLTKFDYRLANKLDTDLQKLRCRVNYHALKFTDPIRQMGNELVRRMRTQSKHFIALHLRYEPDMLAFSGCYYGGGDKERAELGSIRKRWTTLHTSNPEKERRQGRCPLTPEEVGVMLRALGFGSDVHIYVASGEVYGGEQTLAPLKSLFPNYHSKETIASKEELSPFSSFSSRMAALDFIVCDESDAFVTNNNGNMAKILAGRRRYFGHKRTIRPNAKKLHSIFATRANTTWETFVSKVRIHQRGFMGEPKEVRPGRGEFHENPATCICEDSKTKEKADSSFNRNKVDHKDGNVDNLSKDIVESKDDILPDDESDRAYANDNEDYKLNEEKEMSPDYSLFLKSEEPAKLEEIMSD